jgi:syntaxin 6
MQALSKSFRIAGRDADLEKGAQSNRLRSDAEYNEDPDADEDATLAFEMEQQQQLMTKQDNTLDLIGNAMHSLRRQAGTLGQEIGEQVDLIGALDSEVDASQNKLTRALGKMDELARRADDRMGGWCVWILIMVSTQLRL